MPILTQNLALPLRASQLFSQEIVSVSLEQENTEQAFKIFKIGATQTPCE